MRFYEGSQTSIVKRYSFVLIFTRSPYVLEVKVENFDQNFINANKMQN